jgi:multidrug efflux pump subunit AcrB
LKNSTFTILTTFALFIPVGLALLPQLEVSLLPNRSKPTITVTYSMSAASGEVIDAEITTPMEGVLSTLSGLVELKSKTGKGSGRISLTFDKATDMDAMRFEVSALMRQLKGRRITHYY